MVSSLKMVGCFAIGTSPFEQGEVAARRALEIVMKKVDAKGFADCVIAKEFIVTMSGSRMRARNFVYRKSTGWAHAGDQYFE